MNAPLQESIGKNSKELTILEMAEICGALVRYWQHRPNWLLGQFLTNVLSIPESHLYYMSDEEIVKIFNTYFNDEEEIK